MKFRYSRMLAALVVSAVMVAGCGSNQQKAGDVSVNAYKITASDAQVNQTYAGTVVAENSVAVHARVTGYVVEKYVKRWRASCSWSTIISYRFSSVRS